MKALHGSIVACVTLIWPWPGLSQVVMTGRVQVPRSPGSSEVMPLGTILTFASLEGTGAEALSFRTWETEPAGWYRLSGSAGCYTLVFSLPAHFMRPLVMTNLYARPGDVLDRRVTPALDYADFHEGAWDDKPARDYYQTFVARGRSVTQMGFKLATDGVDGPGPGSQNLLVSVHRRGEGTPEQWPQVGPTAVVLNVDCGGPKNYIWSAGWNSGEIPLEPGGTYAVHLKAESPTGTFQAFWRPSQNPAGDCYRLGPAGRTGWVGRRLWMGVSTDGDGLLIPYNKRVHRQFDKFAGFRSRWSQTYVAQGRSLASVILYAAVSGAQPPLSRQRAVVRVREGGPAGRVVGLQKIAVGNGNYTGDASWGVFGLACAPGEVLLEPGQTYAVEFESIENYETLHGFVNIKGQVSDDRPGFNPYAKCAPDSYEKGVAYSNGKDAVEHDLDMQIIEYEFSAANWAQALAGGNLLANGDVESGHLAPDNPQEGRPDSWTAFTIDPSTVHMYIADGAEKNNRILRVTGGPAQGRTADGGYTQRVVGLTHQETYVLSGRVRCSWPVDVDRQGFVGYDPTGQDQNPVAATVVWTTLPSLHGVFVAYRSDPIRPANDTISIWLRGRTKTAADAPFKADFDDFALRRVHTGVPGGR